MLLNLLKKRKSVFSFSPDKTVSNELLEEIFQAASLAPSAMNIQPWRYFYTYKGEPKYEGIYNTLADGNKRWAKDAAVLIVSVAQIEYEYNGKINKNKHAWHDTGMANIQLMLQATELGLVTHPMGGFDAEKMKKELGLSSQYEPIIVIALGYPGDDTLLPSDLLERQQKPKTRKHMSEISFPVK